MTRRRRLLIVIASGLLLVGALATCRWWKTWPARILVRNDRPAAGAPYLVLLMGDSSTSRADKTLELLRNGTAERVLMAREGPFGFIEAGLAQSSVDVHVAYLVQQGISRERIIVEDCATTSTVDEARCLLRYLETQGPLPERVPIVTSWYHSRRAGWLFESAWPSAGPKVEMVPAESPKSNPDVWLSEEQAGVQVVMEYVKTAYWLFKASEARESPRP